LLRFTGETNDTEVIDIKEDVVKDGITNTIQKEYPSKIKLDVSSKIKLDEILESNPPTFNYEIDYFWYILSLFESIPETMRKMNEGLYKIYLDSGYMPLYSRSLQQKIQHYKDYINYLIATGIIETDNIYSHNQKKSKYYRLLEPYIGVVTSVEITKRSLIKSIIIKSRPHQFEVDILPEMPLTEIPYLTKWFNHKLQIDRVKAEEFIKNECEGIKNEKGELQAIRHFNSLISPVRKIIDGDLYYNLSIDKTAGRFHTPLTMLKKELRKHVTYDGQRLVGLDMKSSQLFFSMLIIDKPTFCRNNTDKVLQYYFSKDDSDGGEERISRLKRFLAEFDGETDMVEYKYSVLNGMAYENIGQYTGTYVGYPQNEADRKRKEVERNLTKKVLMKAMNGDIIKDGAIYKYIKKNSLKKSPRFEFIYYFPHVNGVFNILKEKNYKMIAWILQHIEAHYILHTVCKQIAETNAHIPLFTVHDSIVTTEGYSEFVKSEMIRIIEESIGLRPRVSIENWF
jgi:hypothetical protein